MKKIEAFECEYSHKIFATEQAARRSEFRWLLITAGDNLPSPDRMSGKEVMAWLADKLEGGIYPSALPAFRQAVEYLVEHRTAIEGKR